MADVTMPQLGETVTEGTITKWFKKVGEQVAEDEPLFEVSTDKVDSEVPSSASGYVAEILVEEGQTVDVGVKLAVITADEPGGAANGGEGAYSSASWTACAVFSSVNSAASVSAKSMPAVTPPPLMNLPSCTTRASSEMAPNIVSNSR